jgi:hypothetical protein
MIQSSETFDPVKQSSESFDSRQTGKSSTYIQASSAGSYYTYWSFHTYCSDYWGIALFIFITALPFLLCIHTVV